MQLIRIVSILTKVIVSYAISIQYVTLTTTVYQNLTPTDYTTLDSSIDLTTQLFPKVTPQRKPKYPKTYSFKFDNEGLLQLGQGPTPNFLNNSLTSHSYSTIVNDENYTSQWDYDENCTSQWDLDHYENDTFSTIPSTKSLDYYIDQSLTESNSIVESTTIFPIETNISHKDNFLGSETDSELSEGIVTEAPVSSKKIHEYKSVDTYGSDSETESESESESIEIESKTESVATATEPTEINIVSQSSHTDSTATEVIATEVITTDSTQTNSTTTKSTETNTTENTNITENTAAISTIKPPEPSTSKSQTTKPSTNSKSTNSNFIPSNLQTPKSTKSKPSISSLVMVTNPSTYLSSTALPLPRSISSMSKSFSLVVHNNILNGSNSHIIDSFLLFVLFVLSL